MNLSIFRTVILHNELGGDLSLAYRFSDPDGERTGRSGWSFGICQFDTKHNPYSTLCLRECDFTTDEIVGIREQSIPIGPMNEKLDMSAGVVDWWDDKQLRECLEHPLTLCRRSDIVFATEEVLYHLADYHNQFYMSRGGKMHRFLQNVGREILPSDVLKLKQMTLWGKKRPDDVSRRYANVVKAFDGKLN